MRISVITAVYNRVGTVREAIESVQAQRFDGLEHVLIDGASTDGSLEVMRELADARTVLVSEPDEGIYDALSKGFDRATGDAVGLMHSDDLFADDEVLNNPGSLEYPPEQEFNLMQALAMAGGVDPIADPPYATVFREDRATGEILPATFRISGNGLVTASALPIKPGDVISIGHSAGSWTRSFAAEIFQINIGYFFQPITR